MTPNQDPARPPFSAREHHQAKPILTIAVIARNEEDAIAGTLESLARQSVWAASFSIQLILYFNGCTDRTVEVARRAVAVHMKDAAGAVRIVDTEIGGKSRSWNAVVHEVSDPATDYFLFLDADIAFASDEACLSILTLLRQDPHCVAVSGRPVKSFALKKTKTVFERISLRVSEQNRAQRSVNGSLYCLTAQEARKIVLPTQNPAEDGFLNAMIYSDGFSAEPDALRVNQAETVTHYYEPASGMGIFYHERRVAIGTIINRWIFEYLWELKSEVPLGSSIAHWNAADPAWVERIVDRHIGGRRWVVPTGMLFWRMPDRKQLTTGEYLRRLPLALAATAFNITVCWAANRRIKAGSAAGVW